jgi:hypothetical protein
MHPAAADMAVNRRVLRHASEIRRHVKAPDPASEPVTLSISQAALSSSFAGAGISALRDTLIEAIVDRIHAPLILHVTRGYALIKRKCTQGFAETQPGDDRKYCRARQ